MPYEERRVPLDTGELVRLVPPGQRISSLYCIDCPDGVRFGVKFGNNPLVTGFRGNPTFIIADDAPDSDCREGLFVQPAAPAPGLELRFMVSFFARSGP